MSAVHAGHQDFYDVGPPDMEVPRRKDVDGATDQLNADHTTILSIPHLGIALNEVAEQFVARQRRAYLVGAITTWLAYTIVILVGAL